MRSLRRQIMDYLRRTVAQTRAGQATLLPIVLVLVVARAITDFPFVPLLALGVFALLMRIVRVRKEADEWTEHDSERYSVNSSMASKAKSDRTGPHR